MHLAALNIPQLLTSLWRGQLRSDSVTLEDCSHAYLIGDVWQEHGALIEASKRYLPTSFGRAPRNPAQKINSGYKAWEFMLYIWALGPAVFRPYLSDNHWQHFCKLVRGIRIVEQREIHHTQLQAAHTLLIEWVTEYEEMYYARDPDAIHLVRPCVHLVAHLVPETFRWGPLNLVAQWSLENTIGNLGREVRQPSNPFANLAERGLRRAQVNAAVAIDPTLTINKSYPQASLSISKGYTLLPARDETPYEVLPRENSAILQYLQKARLTLPTDEEELSIIRWGAVALPNGQRARSKWREVLRAPETTRQTRDISGVGQRFGEVQYFFQLNTSEGTRNLVLLSLYTRPDEQLYNSSHQTLYACRYTGSISLLVVEVTTILSVVGVAPLPRCEREIEDNEYLEYVYIIEKPFLSVLELAGLEDEYEEDSST
ncbi:hypothetical protein BDN72DRAFT_781498 [Pluteus cervinus]|uniref:Uncharacterized protein n=1 Tax=Pluteus cervinus TaxID=181527 RepID=A0ACD3A1T5_9AGAR|nr:hypothetical protein BDN72DRAFT_781498 [Pluteus cervinus]